MKTLEEIQELGLKYGMNTSGNVQTLKRGFIKGYLTAEKELFTLEDLKEAFDEGSSASSSCSDIEYGFHQSMYDSWKKDFLKQKLDEKELD